MLLAWPEVLKIAWLPEQDENAQPGEVLVMLAVVTVEQLTLSLKLMVTWPFNATPVAPLAGTVDATVGGVVSGSGQLISIDETRICSAVFVSRDTSRFAQLLGVMLMVPV